MKPIAIVALLTLLTSCQYDPYADDMTVKQPKFNDIIGTYKFEKQTIVPDSLIKIAKSATIVLSADNTFKFINIPNTVDDNFLGFVNCSGKWLLESSGLPKTEDSSVPQFYFNLKGVPESLQDITFLGEQPPYKMIITYGDPDEGAVVIFDKVN